MENMTKQLDNKLLSERNEYEEKHKVNDTIIKEIRQVLAGGEGNILGGMLGGNSICYQRGNIKKMIGVIYKYTTENDTKMNYIEANNGWKSYHYLLKYLISSPEVKA